VRYEIRAVSWHSGTSGDRLGRQLCFFPRGRSGNSSPPHICADQFGNPLNHWRQGDLKTDPATVCGNKILSLESKFEFENKKEKSEMNQTTKGVTRLGLLGASLLFGASLMAAPVPQSGQQPAQDNTKMNQGDASKDANTADQQKMNPADRDTTKQIRAAIMKDKSLSTYAHNIKIITQNGKVTLKGPVRSDSEKANIEAKAVAVAGADNVTDQLTIAPPKQ
jgi:hyperosmotically inducible protein